MNSIEQIRMTEGFKILIIQQSWIILKREGVEIVRLNEGKESVDSKANMIINNFITIMQNRKMN